MTRKQKAFTLIELMVVIGIIGVLVAITVVSLNTARNKAKDGAFRSVASNVNRALQVCCDGDGALQAKTSGGGAAVSICSSPEALPSSYPDDDHLGTVTIDSACDLGSYEATLTPGTRNSGNCTNAVVDQTGIVSYAGC